MQVTACLSGDLVGLPIQRRRVIHAAFCRDPPLSVSVAFLFYVSKVIWNQKEQNGKSNN